LIITSENEKAVKTELYDMRKMMREIKLQELL